MRRTYSRASTDDQDATRARETLRIFASKHGTRIAATYVEKASGTLLDRRELLRLLADAERGDVLLVEAIDRLSRLDRATLRPVARPDRPGGPAGGFSRSTTDPFIDPAGYGRRRRSPRVDDAGAIPDVLRIQGGVCSEGLRNATCPRGPGHRQGEGGTSLQRAAQGEQLHARIRECQARGMSVRGTARVLECSTSTVNRCRSQTIAAQK
ncbi:recombinase family protein [Pseudomonas benzopyrenica]|uniref:Recombinase family protein n=1 Tax=Pseudomonas benzopyrenica TaxID=2993566 RepID=A0ABZ2FNB0_9PSED